MRISWRWLWVPVWLGVGAVPAAYPQEIDPDDSPVVVNWAFPQASLNPFDLSGRAFEVYRIPIAKRLRSIDDHSWGLKLTFPVSFGLHEIKGDNIFDQPFKETLATVTLVPGVEFQLPVTRVWTLYPFAEAGAGHDFSRNQWAFIYSSGVRSLVTLPAERAEFRIGTSVEYDGSWLSGRETEIGFGTIKLGLDIRQPVSFRIGGRPTDLGIYVLQRRFIDLAIQGVDGEPVTLQNSTEVGFTFGTDPPPQWWLIKISRFGMGYRWGDGFDALRLLLSMPF